VGHSAIAADRVKRFPNAQALTAKSPLNNVAARSS
jgi:hypothetical protein